MLLTLFGFLLGLLIGSFLNACIFRLPLDISLVNPSRSFCPQCEKTIAWYDNLPLISYLRLKGRCRHCSAKISWRYPVVELSTAVLFALIFSMAGLSWETAKGCVFVGSMIALMFTDLEERILPDEFTLGGLALGLVFAWFVPMRYPLIQLIASNKFAPRPMNVAESAMAAFITAGLLYMLGALYHAVRHREGLGLGDVKLVGMIAAYLDLPGVFFSIFIGSVLGVALGLGYILFTKQEMSNYELPFGTFLCFAAIVGYFLGEPGLHM